MPISNGTYARNYPYGGLKITIIHEMTFSGEQQDRVLVQLCGVSVMCLRVGDMETSCQ